MGTHVTTDTNKLINECDVVILGVKPTMLQSALLGCKCDKDVLFISMLAGVNLEALKKVSITTIKLVWYIIKS